MTATNLARWVSLPIDPITIEDWLANRELLEIIDDDGDIGADLELAYLIEQARGSTKKMGEDYPRGVNFEIILHGYEPEGLVEYDDTVVIAPSGKLNLGKTAMDLELILDWQNVQKLQVACGDVAIFPLDEDQTVKVKAKSHGDLKFTGKREVNWSGKGKKRLIVDGRGRPLHFHASRPQRDLMEKLRRPPKVEKVKKEETEEVKENKKEEESNDA